MWSLAEKVPEETENEKEIQWLFDQAYRGRHDAFKEVLLEARDYMGELLASAWRHLSANDLTFARFGDALLASDRELTGGKFQTSIFENFLWREIGHIPIGPKLEDPESEARSHTIHRAAKTLFAAGLTYRQRMQLARSVV